MSVAALRRAARESVAGLPREFWWLWTSTLVNRLGAFVMTFLAIYLTLDQGYSASYAGLVVALHGGGSVVSSLVAGVMTDRLGRRPTLLYAQLSTAAAVLLLGFMHHPVAIAAAAFLVGMTSNASRPAVQAMIADLVRPEDRVRAFSLNYWAINLGFGVSAIVAGFVAQYSYLAGFVGEAVLTLACAGVVFLRVPESRPVERAREQERGEGAREAEVTLGTVFRDRRFMGLVWLCFLVAVIMQQGFVALPVSMGLDGFSPADYGLVIALNGFLIVAAQLPVTRWIEGRDPRRMLVVSSLLLGYGFALTAFAGSVAGYAVTIVVWTVGEMVNAPLQSGLVARLAPVRGRGRYQGVYTMSWSLSALVGPLLSGFVTDRLGGGWVWGMCAVLGTVTALGYGFLVRGLPEGEGEGAGQKDAPVSNESNGPTRVPGRRTAVEPAPGEASAGL